MTRALAALACAALPLAGCASGGGEMAVATPTQLQVRQAQTRSYPTADTRVVLKAVLDALQDEAFVIKSADADLGLITASREAVQRPNQALKVGKWLTALHTCGLSLLIPNPGRHAILEATANVSSFGQETRVRLSMLLRVLDEKGRARGFEPVEDAGHYQGLLAKVDKSLFLALEKL
jgi:hypothetical protein